MPKLKRTRTSITVVEMLQYMEKVPAATAKEKAAKQDALDAVNGWLDAILDNNPPAEMAYDVSDVVSTDAA